MSLGEPAAFDLAAAEAGVEGTRFAGTLQYIESTGSTNTLALAARRAGARAGVWIAGEQTAGRGRGGHRWHSVASDGLYCSVLLTGGLEPGQIRALPLASGLAVQAAVQELAQLTLDLRWPNDLMAGERKCGGVLVESAAAAAGEPDATPPGAPPSFAVIGIGLNLNQTSFPPELRAHATSLSREDGRWHGREGYLAAILRALDRELDRLGAHPVSVLHARFEAASSWVRGKPVRVGEEPGGYTGVTAGLDRGGFLLVRDERGEIRTVLSGGVRPHPAPPQDA